MLQNTSLWSSLTSCLTPAVLFLLLNLTIVAIALISSFTRHHHHDPLHDHGKIFRSPSILQRLKSINIYAISSESIPKPTTNFFHNFNNQYHHDDDPEPEPEPEPTPDDHNSVIGSNGEEDENQFQTMDEVYSRLKGVQFGRTKSDTEPGSAPGLDRAPGRLRKSESMKPKPKSEEISSVEARRPATTRERVLTKVREVEAGVDEKADDFINNFKKQLQMQRLDSILKYKDRIQRGIGGGGR